MQNSTRHHDRRDLWDKIWKDRHGDVVIWQFPNVPLFAWVGFTILSLLVNGKLSDVLFWLSSASLIIWSLLEIFKGVNYLRRALGIFVLVLAIVMLINAG